MALPLGSREEGGCAAPQRQTLVGEVDFEIGERGKRPNGNDGNGRKEGRKKGSGWETEREDAGGSLLGPTQQPKSSRSFRLADDGG